MKKEGIMHASGTPIVQVGERRRTDSLVYDLACLLGSPFGYEVVGLDNIQTPGPAIFITNHLGPTGPIETVLSIPIRFYPWGIAEMNDPQRAPKYIFDDFVHPVLHLGGKFGLLFATLLTKITVPLFKSIGVIPIDRFGGWTADGFRQSLRLLHEGKNLLIFPENSVLELDPETSMRPFMPGFATLCSLFDREAGFAVPVYPVAVNSQAEIVIIGKPEYFHQQGRHRQAILDFTQLMELRVRQLYLELKHNAESIE
jgi:1-acyl-sn-glycerol-3-phosphate acyltransferase